MGSVDPRRVAARFIRKVADAESTANPYKGWSVFLRTRDSSIMELARDLGQHMVRKLPGSATTVQWLKGSVKAFSFHWSNAQAKWDVIPAKMSDFPYMQDGADFIVFVFPEAISPLGKPWTLVEMKYVAKALPPHPGYVGSVEGGTTF